MVDAGTTECRALERMKRYIKFKVPMLSRTQGKIAHLVLEYRFVEKKELLDLLYSHNNKLSPELTRVHSTGASLPNRHRQRSLLSPRGKASR